LLCGLGLKLDQARIETNQNTTEKRNTKIKPMTELKYRVGDLIQSTTKQTPVVVTSIDYTEEYPTYTVSKDMAEFVTIYADWIDEHMVLCEG
jgi:hypothetical protein